MNLFQRLQHASSTPIRRIVRVVARHNASTGQMDAVAVDSRETTLSGEGSPDTVITQYAEFWDCGHPVTAAMGGRCFECGQIACQACAANCGQCRKPLCPECAQHAIVEGVAAALCRRCAQTAKRRGITRSVLTGLIDPFVSLHPERRTRSDREANQ